MTTWNKLDFPASSSFIYGAQFVCMQTTQDVTYNSLNAFQTGFNKRRGKNGHKSQPLFSLGVNL